MAQECFLFSKRAYNSVCSGVAQPIDKNIFGVYLRHRVLKYMKSSNPSPSPPQKERPCLGGNCLTALR